MAASSPSLSALLKKSTLDDHEQILDACNKALKTSKSDLQAQHVKVVALLKLDRYNEAVKFIEGAGDTLQKTADVEYAYALYKTGRLEEAVELSSKSQERGARHIEAQSRYRLEDSLKTSEVYQRINHHESEEYDMRVNQGAIDAQAQWRGVADVKSIRRPGREDLQAFETAYNAACGSIARGEYAQAEVLLKRAKELCKHSEDLTDQQKTDELLPIYVQQLYVLLCLGKNSEAEALAAEINVEEVSDLSTRKVAENNLLLVTSADNPFLAYKAFHTTAKIPPEDKLFSYQNTPLTSNKATLDLRAFKFEGLRSSTTKAQHRPLSLSADDLISSCSSAAARAGNETGKAAINKILPILEREPNDVGTILTLVQLYFLNGDSTSAVEILESFLKRLEQSVAEHEQEIRFSPLLVSLLISLYKTRGQKAHVKQELAKAAAYWRTQSSPPTSLLTAAGVSLLESQNDEDTTSASEIFAKLKQQQPDDKATAAGYVASHAADESSQLKADIDKLTPVADLTRDVDVTSIENAGIPQSSNALAIAQLGRTRKRAAPDVSSVKPKRVRKSRIPKDYDEKKKPDPERWLPMKDRSYYRPPKGRKKAKKGGDTQGGVVNEDLNVDAKPAAPVVSTSGGGKTKKKGKGKK
ncbi:Signal recognition particle subunit SRP72 [Exophiala xenobiotica]|uniref:Signal recognition particle subunit SRP72 n=1 Tax=Vermiconidia calcicola TaxID=1690605 RepID=A0AAV9PVX4_9PEZI|nr:Signal recognition particle subunit SRP72 [Exophiala xenobiotica]KAK5529403.1 Signal recognition particle subunit SRP72 [Vermiconidia calcicola]KAK5537988.1 Signal recognition particle subunit SRP72 [Chaetothyriales sp. CCFEE 6169]KAK5293264.1 Signal recognition particle subunit SRP72 [Exophiala xenobiotica]KAK5301787.1 Signal recognition particle subunit SRP72 [Exophiala xenobiotica]